jgi:hypothetical protein
MSGDRISAFVDPVLGAFLYLIAFIEMATVIRVLAVAHERRRPGY